VSECGESVQKHMLGLEQQLPSAGIHVLSALFSRTIHLRLIELDALQTASISCTNYTASYLARQHSRVFQGLSYVYSARSGVNCNAPGTSV
jgi:hypothetical protein